MIYTIGKWIEVLVLIMVMICTVVLIGHFAKSSNNFSNSLVSSLEHSAFISKYSQEY